MIINEFITYKTLIDYYNLDANTDEKYVLPLIHKGQDLFIKPVIGNLKFNEISEQLEDDTLTDVNIDLLEKIEPALAYYVLSEVPFLTSYKMKNNTNYNDNVNVDRYEELIRISRHYLNDAQSYIQILKEYIEDNNVITRIDEEGYLKNTYKSGIYFTKRNYGNGFNRMG